MIDATLLEILACPNCESRPPFRQEGDQLVCTECGRRYPTVDGIPHLLPESAVEPEKEDDVARTD